MRQCAVGNAASLQRRLSFAFVPEALVRRLRRLARMLRLSVSGWYFVPEQNEHFLILIADCTAEIFWDLQEWLYEVNTRAAAMAEGGGKWPSVPETVHKTPHEMASQKLQSAVVQFEQK